MNLADGWLELDNFVSASNELEEILVREYEHFTETISTWRN